VSWPNVSNQYKRQNQGRRDNIYTDQAFGDHRECSTKRMYEVEGERWLFAANFRTRTVPLSGGAEAGASLYAVFGH
jgi:hypothetical protein